jgi:D-threo-aldose 1-dehydrogenase
MNHLPKVRWARSLFETPNLGFGASLLGPLGDAAREQECISLVQSAFEAGLRYFDVAPFYGFGLAELRLGSVLRHIPRHEFVLSTKVGRILSPSPARSVPDRIPFSPAFDYGQDATLRSLDHSLARLSLSSVDLVLVHDLSAKWHDPDLALRMTQALGGAFPTLERLRSDGTIRAFGIGTNDPEAAARAVEAADLDVVMLAGAPTLLNSGDAQRLLDLCAGRQIDVIAAAPFNSGILATGLRPGARYFYQEPPPDVADRTRRLQALCAAYGVPLGAAALQYPLRHPAVRIVLPGIRTEEELGQSLLWQTWPIPDDFWQAIERL